MEIDLNVIVGLLNGAVQVDPFQWIRVPLSPTAQPSVAETMETERNQLVVGLGVELQVLPSQCSMIPFQPTAQPSSAVNILTAYMSDIGGVTRVHEAPFHFRITPAIGLPEFEAHWSKPISQLFDEEMVLTAVKNRGVLLTGMDVDSQLLPFQ
jgi:hypothetical protein